MTPQISSRARQMPASPIRKLMPLAEDAKRRGVRVHHLNIGQPDVETPAPMLEKLRSCRDRVLAYSPSGGTPEYLATLASRPMRLNAGAFVGHTPLRLFVLGGEERAATGDEIEAMCRIVREAVEAGALGFSTSRQPAHQGAFGRPVPSRFAETDEVYALAGVLGELGRGIVQVSIGPGLFVEQFSAEALQTERQRFTTPAPRDSPAGAPPTAPSSTAPAVLPAAAPFDAEGFYESLRAQLLDAQAIDQADLTALAAARSTSIVAALTAGGVIDATRVKMMDPATAKRQKRGSTRVASELTMSADAGVENEK